MEMIEMEEAAVHSAVADAPSVVVAAAVVVAADAVEAEAAEAVVAPVADGNGKSTRIANLLIV